MQRLKIQSPSDPSYADQLDALQTALGSGQVVILPTETVYGLAVDAQNPAAGARLNALKGRDPAQPLTHHLAKAEDLETLAAPLPARLRRFLDTVWPGPITAIVPAIAPATGQVGLRVPAHPLTTQVIEGLGHSLFMSSVNRHGAAPLNDPDAIQQEFGDCGDIALFADAGAPRLGEASVVIRLDGRRLEVLRQGIFSTEEVLRGAATKVLFVCSGNTCRSPLAEAIARKLAAENLGIEAGAVLAHGLCFASAGTGTMNGMPASPGSLAAAAEVGLDLSGHGSTQLTDELIHAADRIFCLSASHRMAILHGAPDAAAKTELLDPDGGDVVDPFGADLAIYRQTREAIDKLVRRRMAALLAESERSS